MLAPQLKIIVAEDDEIQQLYLCALINGLELLSNLVFEGCWSCGDLVGVCGFDSVFERDACDDFREVVKAA
jgi:hypothetical protein